MTISDVELMSHGGWEIMPLQEKTLSGAFDVSANVIQLKLDAQVTKRGYWSKATICERKFYIIPDPDTDPNQIEIVYYEDRDHIQYRFLYRWFDLAFQRMQEIWGIMSADHCMRGFNLRTEVTFTDPRKILRTQKMRAKLSGKIGSANGKTIVKHGGDIWKTDREGLRKHAKFPLLRGEAIQICQAVSRAINKS